MPRTSARQVLRKPEARSRVTNGKCLLPGVDGRSLWSRRAYDLFALHLSDLGGADNVSEAERSIVRRAAVLEVELEQLEKRFATGDHPATEDATGNLLDRYQRCANTLRRLLESLGLERRAKDVRTIDADAELQAVLDVWREDDAKAALHQPRRNKLTQ